MSRGTPRTKSLSRAALLIGAVAGRSGGRSASELARETGIPRATVARTLTTLADVGFVEASDSGWVLGHELVRLAREADPHRRLVDAAYPALAELRADAGESALLAVPHGRPGMEILLQLDAERHVGVANWVGVDVPLHASSAGKLILGALAPNALDAWLAGARLEPYTERTITEPGALRTEVTKAWRQRYAELADELETGLASISMPVSAKDGSLAGVIGVSGPTFRLGKGRRRALLPRLRTAAAAIERALA